MHAFQTKEPINKGWSGDQKYRVTKQDGTRYLLRVSALREQENKQHEFRMMQRLAELGIPMCRPIDIYADGADLCVLHEWIDGFDAEEVMASFPERTQYDYGWQASKILHRIHSIPAPSAQEEWEIRFNRKMDRKIKAYSECPIHYENGDAFIRYINENRQLLKDRPQTFQHGDFHIGNMMLTRSGDLRIIDFNRCDYGDPWEEFNRIVWCVQKAPPFACGMVDGYFDGTVPYDFWRMLAMYIASNTLSSVYWAIPFGEKEVHTMLQQARDVLLWYDGMQNPIPTWYR